MRRTEELLAADREVLRYKVFTVEAVPGNPSEPARTRVLECVYFTVDSTLRLFEPHVVNSGLLQGVQARRHLALVPDGSRPYGPRDLLVGATITVYKRDYVIVDADAATRSLVQSRYGITLGAPLPIPEVGVKAGAPVIGHRPKTNTVAFDAGREEDSDHGFYRRAGDTRAQYLSQGSSVLKLECEWREPGAPFGDVRRCVVQYYLADDTMEICDRSSAYTSGGLFTKLIQRQRLPRLPIETGTEAYLSPAVAVAVKEQPGLADRVLAASDAARAKYKPSTGTSLRGKFTSPITGRPIFTPHTDADADAASTASSLTRASGGAGAMPSPFDAPAAHAGMGATSGPLALGGLPVLSSHASSPEFVTAADLIPGGLISVYGRPMLLKSCDPFTVAHHLHCFGTDLRDCFIPDAAKAAGTATPSKKTVPLGPHVGALAVGSEEETRRNASKLIPTYRRTKDAERMKQLGGKALRFEACLDPAMADPEDGRRRFLVSFYLEDETLSIGELTGLTPGFGPSVVRWLNRGRYRNACAPPDKDAADALCLHDPLTPMPRSVLAAYDRVFGCAREKIGFTDLTGAQGYGGGIYGKAERVGAGGTGVSSAADMGVRDASRHAFAPPPRYFAVEDFTEGGRLVLAHMPTVAFILAKPDTFTANFLAALATATAGEEAGAAGGASTGTGIGIIDAKDVYVPESADALPSMPLERVRSTEAAAEAGYDSPAASAEHTRLQEVRSDCLLLAKVLAGVWDSVRVVVRQQDKTNRGFAPLAIVQAALAEYGAQPPAVPLESLERVLDAYTLVAPEAGIDAESIAAAAAATLAKRPAVPSPFVEHKLRLMTEGLPSAHKPVPRVSTAAVGSIQDRMQSAVIRDFGSHAFIGVPMVDYEGLFTGVRTAAAEQLAQQPRMEKLMSQLRSALLSSRTHLRKVFRDLDVAGKGAITMPEFRRLLSRHNLDVGICDAQLRVLMQRFPPAPADVQAVVGSPAIDWRGFVESLLEASTLAPEEVETFVSFVKGMRDTAADGVGGSRVVPQVCPRTNAASAWTPATADPSPYLARLPPATPPAHAAAAVGGYSSISRPSSAASSVSAPSASSAYRPASAGGSVTGSHIQAANGVASPAVSSRRVSDDSGLGMGAAGPVSGPSVPGGGSPMHPVSAHTAMPSGSIRLAPPTPPVPAARAPAGGSPATAAASTVSGPGGGSPGILLASAPRKSALTGAASSRILFDGPVVDVITALSATPEGSAFLDNMRKLFRPKRFDLYRAFSLYDTTRKRALSVQSFIAALTSAGLKLNLQQAEAFKDVLLSHVPPASVRDGKGKINEHDVGVDYNGFFDALFGV